MTRLTAAAFMALLVLLAIGSKAEAQFCREFNIDLLPESDREAARRERAACNERYRGATPSPGREGRGYNSSADGLRRAPEGEIHQRCVMSWDDPPQLHSFDRGDVFRGIPPKTTMKKQRNCIRLTVFGPVELETASREYVDRCFNEALNRGRVRHLFELVLAVGADVLSEGSTGGSVTAAKLTDWIVAVVDEMVTCMTDIDSVQDALRDALGSKLKASIVKDHEWIYWDL